jgi:hypothetical protein
MADELEELRSKIRETLQQNGGTSLAGVLREAGISPDRQEKVKGLLGGMGFSDGQLLDPAELAKIAQGFLSSMPEEARRQLLGVALQVVTEMSGKGVPPGITDALSRQSSEESKDVPPDPSQRGSG